MLLSDSSNPFLLVFSVIRFESKDCDTYAKAGECSANPAWMNYNCKASCGWCKASSSKCYRNENKICFSAQSVLF